MRAYLSIARARCELKQLCCYINLDISVKKSDVSEHYEFDYRKLEKKKEKRGGHIIKCLLTELGRAGRENIWPSFMAHGPRCARSVRHDLGPPLEAGIFRSKCAVSFLTNRFFALIREFGNDKKWQELFLLVGAV